MKLSYFGFLVASVTLVPSAQAQSGVDAEIVAGVRGTRLTGGTELMLGGDVRLGISESVSLGGTGWVLTSPLGIPAESGSSELLLDVGYGGAAVEIDLLARDGRRVGLRLTLGAGHAEVSLTDVGTEIAADNFGVIEPELVGGVDLGRVASIRVQAGYRLVFGVEDLPGVTKQDLQGPSVSLGIALRKAGRP